MRWLAVAVLLGGCDLYFGHDAPGGHPISGDPDGPPGNTDVIAADCLRTVAAGPLIRSGSLLPSADSAVFYTHVCQPDGGAVIGVAQVVGGTFTHGTEHADFQDAFRRTVLADLDGDAALDSFSLDAHQNHMWIFSRFGSEGPGTALGFGLPYTFDDLLLTDMDGDGATDLVVTGDGAIRYTPIQPNWPPINGMMKDGLTGKPYRYLAQTALGGDAQPDLFYVATADGQPIELGTAIKTSTQPAYTIASSITEPPGSALPLVTADIDGDGIADVIGATSHVFVRSTRYGALVFLEEPAAALAAGDVDGDGVADAVFITGDHQTVRRVRIGTQAGVLKISSEPLIPDGGDQIAAADLDGDHRADLVLLQHEGQPDSRLVLHRSATY